MTRRKANGSKKERPQHIRQLSDQEIANLDEAIVACSSLTDYMDSNDLSAALIEARALLSHSNPEVRRIVYDALNWIGKDAIYDLSEMIYDADEELRMDALDSFWDQMSELPNDQAKLNLIERISSSQDEEIQGYIMEALAEFHPYMAYAPMVNLLNIASDQIREDIHWELETITGESFNSVDDWNRWFNENKIDLEGDYRLSSD